MPQYFLAVLHDAGVQASSTAYADEAAMEEAFAKVGAFNDSLGARMVAAGGLVAPEDAAVVAPDGTRTPGPADPGATKPLGGFWIIEAEDDGDALATAARGAQACGQQLEVRRLQG